MKKLLIFTAAICFLAAGCSNNEENALTSSTKELKVSASSINCSTSTRSVVTGESFASGNSIGIFVNGSGYTPKKAIFTVTVTNPSQIWAPTTESDNIYLSGLSAIVYGFYPASTSVTLDNSENHTSTIDISVPATDGFNASSQNDYMYAVGESVVDNNKSGENSNSTTLNFHHALSELSFIVNLDASYPIDANGNSGKIASIKLTSTDDSPFTAGDGTMKVLDGTINITGTSKTLTFTGNATCNAYKSTPSANPVAVQLVAPKTAIPTSLTLELIIDNKTMSTTLTTPATSWDAGKNYSYTITVKGTQLLISSVSITDWTPATGGSGTVQ